MQPFRSITINRKPNRKPNTKLFTVILFIFLTGCSSLPIQYTPSQNYNNRVRYLVLHFTAANFEKSMNYMVDEHRVSSHYLIPENHDDTYQNPLRIFQLVDESFRAWHAGVSHWDGQDNLNDLSIGIELVNVPDCHQQPEEIFEPEFRADQDYGNRYCFYPDYDPEQIQLLITLIRKIRKQYPEISPTNIVGHSDIAPSRKLDPGPRFPWYHLYKEGIGAWYDNKTVTRYWHDFSAKPPSLTLIQLALQEYGYNIKATGKMDDQTSDVLVAFQTHFLPWQIDGDADLMTTATVFALLEKYHPDRSRDLTALYQAEQDEEQNRKR